MFSYRLKKLRKEKGLTLQALADALNNLDPSVSINKGQLSKWENHKGLPTLSNAKLVADFFNVPLDFLMGDDTDIINQSAPDWATTQDKLQLLDFLNGNVGFNIGPRELTDDEERKMREILATLFWDDLADFRARQSNDNK